MAGTREWDAGTYDRVSAPQLSWGRAVLDRLEPAPDAAVVDAGCGSGRVTEMLLEELPTGRLVAVDGSAAMIAQARERLGTRAELIHSDLLELELDEPVDAVFSSATFHWIRDHARLFARVADWLRPGGRLEAQCGGEGNVATFFAAAESVAERAPYAEHLSGLPESRHFAGPVDTERHLRAAGFSEVRCWLEPSDERPPEPRAYIESVCLGAHTVALPEQLRAPFCDDVYDAWGPDRVLDYVRLNISAKKEGPAELTPDRPIR